MKLLAGLGLGNQWKTGREFYMYIWRFLTKALIFKPKKLENGWEHKKGFYVSIEAEAALNILDSARNKKYYSGISKSNIYQGLDRDILRSRAKEMLYEIESSSNNYIELICTLGGLGIVIYLWDLITLIWMHPDQDSVRLFLVLLLALGLLIFLYFKKMKIDRNNIETFLDTEDALYKHEYNVSQYKN